MKAIRFMINLKKLKKKKNGKKKNDKGAFDLNLSPSCYVSRYRPPAIGARRVFDTWKILSVSAILLFFEKKRKNKNGLIVSYLKVYFYFQKSCIEF